MADDNTNVKQKTQLLSEFFVLNLCCYMSPSLAVHYCGMNKVLLDSTEVRESFVTSGSGVCVCVCEGGGWGVGGGGKAKRPG